MNKPVKVAILDSVERKYWVSDEGRTDSQKFIDLLSPNNASAEFDVFYVTENQFPASLKHYDCVLLTGSPASVHHDFDWIGNLSSLIQQADQQNKPVVASCFGHQLVAKTYGGKVGFNENGWMIGNYKLTISRCYDWMPSAVSETGLYHFNQERVTALPEAAISFASSEDYADFAYTIGDNILCVQGHPEQPQRSMNNFLSSMEDIFDQEALSKARSKINDTQPDSDIWGDWMMRFMTR